MAFRILFCIIIAALYIIPFIIVTACSFFLRKLSFSAKIGGPKTLTDVMIRYEVKMNFAILVRIEKLQLKFNIPYLVSKNLFELHVP